VAVGCPSPLGGVSGARVEKCLERILDGMGLDDWIGSRDFSRQRQVGLKLRWQFRPPVTAHSATQPANSGHSGGESDRAIPDVHL
jgi:hypothetical protein